MKFIVSVHQTDLARNMRILENFKIAKGKTRMQHTVLYPKKSFLSEYNTYNLKASNQVWQ